MTEKKIKNTYKYKYIWNIFFIYFFILFIYLFLLLFSGTQLRICVQVATPLHQRSTWRDNTALYRDLLIVLPMREPSVFRGIAVSLLRPVIGSRYKTNCDFETAIPHYIDGVGRKYIPPLFRVRSTFLPEKRRLDAWAANHVCDVNS